MYIESFHRTLKPYHYQLIISHEAMPVLTLVAQGPLMSRFTPFTPFSFMHVVQGSNSSMYVLRIYIHTHTLANPPESELEGQRADANRNRGWVVEVLIDLGIGLVWIEQQAPSYMHNAIAETQ